MKCPSIAILFFLLSSLTAPVYPEKGYVIEPMAEGLNFPWSIEFLNDGDLIVAELGGTIRHVDANGKVSEPISGTPSVYRAGQGGLLMYFGTLTLVKTNRFISLMPQAARRQTRRRLLEQHGIKPVLPI